MFSTEVDVAFAPDTTYRALAAGSGQIGTLQMFRRPVAVALVIGTAVPIMAVQRVTIGLVAASMGSFAFVVVIQAAVGAAVIASAPSRPVTMGRGLDLWFAGHLPYSVWLLMAAAAFAALSAASLDLLILLAVLPAAWTAVIVAAFCRNVLGTSRTGARWRTAAHFIVVWAVAFELVALSAGGWFQITSSVTRLFR